MSDLATEVTEFLSCRHDFDEYDSNLNGADAECIHCGSLAGDVFPEDDDGVAR